MSLRLLALGFCVARCRNLSDSSARGLNCAGAAVAVLDSLSATNPAHVQLTRCGAGFNLKVISTSFNSPAMREASW